MSGDVRIMIEHGIKRKKVVAVAFDWPGWERSGKSEVDALAVLDTYRGRYQKVASLAGLGREFESAGQLTVVEHAEPSSSPDFLGMSGRSASAELLPMTHDQLERKIALLRACWRYFDEVHPTISEELKRGPRGGGKDRDQIVHHTYFAEDDMARKVNVRTGIESLGTPEGIAAHRDAFVEGIRRVNAGEPTRSSWTVQFVLRRACYHMLDHAWELKDKDLTVSSI